MASQVDSCLRSELRAAERQSLEVFSTLDSSAAADKLFASVSALERRFVEAKRSGKLSPETSQLGYTVLQRVSIAANSLAAAEEARHSNVQAFERDIDHALGRRASGSALADHDFFRRPTASASLVGESTPSRFQRRAVGQGDRACKEWFKDHLDDPTPKGNARLRLAEATGWDVKQVDAWFSGARARSGWAQLRKTTRRSMFEVLQLGRSMPSLLEPAERSGLKRLQQWLDDDRNNPSERSMALAASPATTLLPTRSAVKAEPVDEPLPPTPPRVASHSPRHSSLSPSPASTEFSHALPSPRRSPSPSVDLRRRASDAGYRASSLKVEVASPHSSPAGRASFDLLSPASIHSPSRLARSPSPATTTSRSPSPGPQYTGVESYPSPESPRTGAFTASRRARSPSPLGSQFSTPPRRKLSYEDGGISSYPSPPESPPEYIPASSRRPSLASPMHEKNLLRPALERRSSLASPLSPSSVSAMPSRSFSSGPSSSPSSRRLF